MFDFFFAVFDMICEAHGGHGGHEPVIIIVD